jgi:selenocysteine-specific elongation factor
MQVVGTAGHVDHGKSTLLRALTGMEPDRWEEEQRRGLTIDLGFVWMETTTSAGDPLTIAFVDVPGHERFVGNMLAGAGAVPLALFVVAADDGWSAQSQEHLEILDLLRIPAALVAVTKAAAVGTPRAEEVARDVESLIAGTSLDGAPVTVVDSLTGQGIDDLRETLVRRITELPRPADIGRPRLWVDRSFTVSGAGTVVTGSLAGGVISAGDELRLLPSDRRIRVRGLQALGQPVSSAEPGSRLALNLAGVDQDEVGRGDAVVSTGEPWHTTSAADAWLRALPGCELGRRGAWHLHVGTAQRVVEVRPLLGEPVAHGAPGHVRLLLDRPLPLVSGDRFVIRDAGRRETAGGGVILDPDPPPGHRGPEARLARAEDLDLLVDAQTPEPRLTGLVHAYGGAVSTDRARASAGLSRSSPVPRGFAEIAGHLLTADAFDRLVQAIVEAADSAHTRDPTGPGSTRDALAEAAQAAGSPAALAAGLVDSLVTEGRLARRGSAYTLAEHADTRDAARRDREQELLAILDADPFSPPLLEEAAAKSGLRHEEVNALVTRGEIIDCGEVAFSSTAFQSAVERLANLAGRTGGRFTTAQAREELETTRKYVIPLLERLDTLGITDFDGQTRAILRKTSSERA